MITIICVTYVQKDFEIRTLIKQLLVNIKFHEIATNSQKIVSFKV